MGVVRLVRVGHVAVGHGGVDGRGQEISPDDLSLRRAALRVDELDGQLTRVEPGSGDHRGYGVQDVVLGLLRHRLWQLPLTRGGDVRAEAAHDALFGH